MKFEKFIASNIRKEEIPKAEAGSSFHALSIPAILIKHGIHSIKNKFLDKKIDESYLESHVHDYEIELAHRALSKHYDLSYDKMDAGKIQQNRKYQNQRQSIKDYTQHSLTLNKILHSGVKDDILSQAYSKKHITNLDSLCSSKEAPQNLFVYSGLNDENIHSIIKAGGTIHHKAYLSSSLDHKVAKSFSDPIEPHVLKINIPEGSKHGFYLGQYSSHPHEKEFLLNRNKILSVNMQPEIKYLEGGKKVHYWHTRIIR